MLKILTPIRPVINTHTPSPLLLPASLERKSLSAGWSRSHGCGIQLQHRDHPPDIESAEFTRLRKRHSEHIVALSRVDVPMRLVSS
jgi:hypothetical protein